MALGCTYVFEKVIIAIRAAWGITNVAEKTLVDDRFLI